ncbi:MAG: hypothetical protein L7S58_01145 [Acidimicrobiales bacterium]|nr:hypothetical protein [Acidimicrobiales bacterium]
MFESNDTLKTMREDGNGKKVNSQEIVSASNVSPALPPADNQLGSPSRPVRVFAFVSILVGGLCGGLIGYAFTDLQCSGDCSNLLGLSALIGAIIGAVGVGVVSILVLRAMTEWRTKHKKP